MAPEAAARRTCRRVRRASSARWRRSAGGTAIAMHSARRGHDVALWANPHDLAALRALKEEGRHPSLPEHLPAGVALFGPEDLASAADRVEIAIMAAHSDGARSLARMVGD